MRIGEGGCRLVLVTRGGGERPDNVRAPQLRVDRIVDMVERGLRF